MSEKISVISSYDFVKHEINYGSLYQYYALQKFLEMRGHRVEWIRYVYKKRFVKKIVDEMSKIGKESYFSNKICLSKFRYFIRTRLKVTPNEYFSGKEIQKACEDSTVFITGSDQVWGAPIEENFLTFASNGQKKVSYAASFGRKDIETEMFNIISPWILAMDYISLREESGRNICKRIGRRDTVVVPDPTLLLDSNEYPVKYSKIEEPYIFGYFLNLKDDNTVPQMSIKDYLDKAGEYRFISCVTSGTRIVPDVFKENRVFPSPEEWLGYYQNSNIIFTNSFHGTVFTLIFQKPFIVFPQNGVTSKQNERIYNLLNIFNLTERIYSPKSSIENILDKTIKWENVSKIMDEQRKMAIKFFEMIGL